MERLRHESRRYYRKMAALSCTFGGQPKWNGPIARPPAEPWRTISAQATPPSTGAPNAPPTIGRGRPRAGSWAIISPAPCPRPGGAAGAHPRVLLPAGEPRVIRPRTASAVTTAPGTRIRRSCAHCCSGAPRPYGRDPRTRTAEAIRAGRESAVGAPETVLNRLLRGSTRRSASLRRSAFLASNRSRRPADPWLWGRWT